MENGFQGKEGQQVPEMTPEIVNSISERYMELFEHITGEKFVKADTENIATRIEKNVTEYLIAGGLILVLGIGQNGAYPVNNFCGTGMHGGKIVLRCDKAPTDLPRQVLVSEVSEDDMTEFAPYIKEYAQLFDADAENLLSQKYFVLTPNPEAGYKQLYTFEA